jgi:N-acetylglutamate synthase-like GNAT family acetyltransferase
MESEKEDIHFVLQDKSQVVGCVILVPEKESIKLRQMAIDEGYQGKGLGGVLLEGAESYARVHGYKEIYCHARKVAVGFYKKNQWFIDGNEFKEVGIPHYKMVKKL